MNTTRSLSHGRNGSVHDMVLLASFTAIIFLLAFSPLGYIHLPLIKATIVHVPVIMGSLLLGPKKGAILGFFFGLTSLIMNTMSPSLLSFAFSPLIPLPGMNQGSILALAVCFIPRILVGIVPWMSAAFFKRFFHGKLNQPLQLTISGILGSMTNTVFVLGFIDRMFRNEYAAVKGLSASQVLYAILGVVTTNGLIEALIAGVLTAAVCLPLLRYTRLFPITTEA